LLLEQIKHGVASGSYRCLHPAKLTIGNVHALSMSSLIEAAEDGNGRSIAATMLAFREQIENTVWMAASSKLMIGEAERRFPVRVRIAVPPEGFGGRRDALTEWLDATCGADGWAMTPSGLRGVASDAVAIYFRDAAVAGAFVARWCQASPAVALDGAFLVRSDLPAARAAAPSHRTLNSPED
jgi:hypothetical protein